MRTKQSGFVGVIVVGLLGLLAIFGLIYLFVARPFKVFGRAMQPTLMSGDRLVLDLVSYRFDQPKRGDVVIFSYPDRADSDSVGRIIGLPGEKIMVDQGKVWINGQILEEDYLAPGVTTNPSTMLSEGLELTIPTDSYAMMGDDRINSGDSRQNGFVPRNLIKGKYGFTYQQGN